MVVQAAYDRQQECAPCARRHRRLCNEIDLLQQIKTSNSAPLHDPRRLIDRLERERLRIALLRRLTIVIAQALLRFLQLVELVLLTFCLFLLALATRVSRTVRFVRYRRLHHFSASLTILKFHIYFSARGIV